MRKKLIIRWSLLTSGLIALYWAVFYFSNGEVPCIRYLDVTENWGIPCGNISRWWSVLAGPIWSIIFVVLFTNKKVSKIMVAQEFPVLTGSAILLTGLMPGLSFGFYGTLAFSLGLGLFILLGFGMLLFLPGRRGRDIIMATELIIALGTCLGICLGFFFRDYGRYRPTSELILLGSLVFSYLFFFKKSRDWLLGKN